MAQKLVFIDDFNFEEGNGVRTVAFGLEGVTFQIDLCEDNLKELYEVLTPYVERGRRITDGARVPEALRRIMNGQTVPGVTVIHEPDPDDRKHTKEEVAECKAWLDKFGVPYPFAKIPIDMWRAFRANDPTLMKPERFPANNVPKAKTTTPEKAPTAEVNRG